MSGSVRTLRLGAPFRVLLWPLACSLALAGGTSLSPQRPPRTAPIPTAKDWRNATETQTEVATQGPENQTRAETDITTQTDSSTSNYTGLACVSVLPPRRGSFYVESGNGVSVGTVLAFWCREGYQLVGSDKISCYVRAGKPQWSNYLPVCEAIPRPEDRGLRVAVLASVVSGIVILAMSLSFIICCLQERSGRDRSRRDSRGRRREKRSRRGECWLEREEGEWDAFPPPKIFHLSQHLDSRLAPDSPLYLGGMAGYENRGYQRSQESLLKTPLPGLYRSESQMYPHMVLQRVPTPTAPSAPAAPVYLHMPPSTSPSNAGSQPHLMAPYSTTAFPNLNPNPNSPQRPWQ
ncbi:uncharacterized protein zgc:162331 [Osmerus eperlanus]|uniref:uncharacterized protein zgc:162331 n=1 Tax=Osmerus eperlanus TaxID=29151 RepID=UPI002E1499F6